MVGENINEIISVKIEVELDTREQIIKIFGRIDNGYSIQLCDGKAELKLISTENSLAFDGGLTAEFILAFSIGVASGVVANAFYAAICAGIKKIEINGQRTRITEESIAQTLETIKDMILSSEEKKCINTTPKKRKNKGAKKKKKR